MCVYTRIHMYIHFVCEDIPVFKRQINTKILVSTETKILGFTLKKKKGR